jgi:hypothetical protein
MGKRLSSATNEIVPEMNGHAGKASTPEIVVR